MIMVAWDDDGEMGRSMIIKDLVGNIKDSELPPQGHGKSLE